MTPATRERQSMTRHMERAVAALSPRVGEPAAVLLVFVLKNEPIQQTTVEESLGWSKSKTSRVVVDLCQRGLLVQAPGEAEHRRGPRTPLLVVPEGARVRVVAWARDVLTSGWDLLGIAKSPR